MEFGDKLKALREENGLTREELASNLKISYSAISKYETNVRFPDQTMIKKIAEFFHVSTDYLLGRTDTLQAEPTHSQELDKRLRELLSDPEMLVAFKGLEDMTDEEKEGLITYLEGMKIRREKKGK